MKINCKSDFDFLLELYAADPHGSAVSAGFPEYDFTGKLTIGQDRNSKNAYVFSKSGNRLINCRNDNGHLRVIVNDHSLQEGPLFCELTLLVPDATYPDGVRNAVYSFPLNIYLTDSDSDSIQAMVSVAMPIVQLAKETVGETTTDQPQEIDKHAAYIKEVQRRTNTRTMLKNSVCKKCFCSGAIPGNIYRNNGAMKISFNLKKEGKRHVKNDFIDAAKKVGVSIRDLIADLYFIDAKTGTKIYPDDIFIENENGELIWGDYDEYNLYYQIGHEEYPYVTIDEEGRVRFLEQSPVPEFKIAPISIEEFANHIIVDEHGNSKTVEIDTEFFIHKNVQFMKWVTRRVEYDKEQQHRNESQDHIYWTKLKKHTHEWRRIVKFTPKTAICIPLRFRIAREYRKFKSEWSYFKICNNWDKRYLSLIETDETGARKGRSIKIYEW